MPAINHTDLINKEETGIIDHADQSVTPAKLASPFIFPSFPSTPAAMPTADYEVANKAYVDSKVSMKPSFTAELATRSYPLINTPTFTATVI